MLAAKAMNAKFITFARNLENRIFVIIVSSWGEFVIPNHRILLRLAATVAGRHFRSHSTTELIGAIRILEKKSEKLIEPHFT